MRASGEKGLTLVEVVMAVAIMGMIAAGTTALISSYLDANAYATAKSQLYREGLMAMEHMIDGVKRCTFLAIPNAHNPTRDILAYSGTINEDKDYYFGDALFPRIDEDTKADSNEDGMHGIVGIDDDGDGDIDEWHASWQGGDDDEDAFWDWEVNEDPVDGIDNDGDGNIDEDVPADMNNDTKPGISGMDDDGDTLVDENAAAQEGIGDAKDDDEDGLIDEDNFNETIYTFDSATNTLLASCPYTGESSVLSTHVTFFEAYYGAPERIRISLTLTGDDGETISFVEAVYPRNTFQKTGKRVR
jgi:prepilin-type N-terminal cleavage/methylation domain-containing protein